jgi:hypothetical protein
MTGSGPGKWVPKANFVMPEVPASLEIDALLLALLHADAFFQLSEDEAVDPDAAVEASEHIAGYLSRLPPARVSAIKAALNKLAAYGKRNKWPEDAIDFIADYWENSVGDDEEE